MLDDFRKMNLPDKILCVVSVAFTAVTWPLALVAIVNMLTMAMRGLR